MLPNPTISPNRKHHHFDSNIIGRDFICGDLQGCYDQLMGILDFVRFDKDKDRLFAVGDLIDRGPKSMECAQLVYEPWFHTTLGNHEKMMFESILHQHNDYHQTWIYNGGLWHINEEDWQLKDIAKSFSDLPLVISIGNDENRFNIVHAELIRVDIMSHKITPVSDADIDNWTFHNLNEHEMIWGRYMTQIRTPPKSYKLRDIDAKIQVQSEQLSTTYVGHSIVPFRPVQIERQIYIDTGCVNNLRGGAHKFNINYVMTVACPTEQMFYIYHPGWKTFTKYPYSAMKKYS